MNRRQFLVSLLGAAVANQLPYTPALEAKATDAWAKVIIDAIHPIFENYYSDFLIYGTAAIAWTEEFPFVRNVPYEELMALPEVHRSLGEFNVRN